MANVQAIRTALASQLQELLGIPAFGNMPPQVSPPMIAILPGSPYIRYGATMGDGLDAIAPVMGDGPLNPASKTDIMLTVMVVISLGSGYEAMQPALDALLEPAGNSGSITSALAADDTLGGQADFCVPLDVATYGIIQVAGQEYFGARIRVQIGA